MEQEFQAKELEKQRIHEANENELERQHKENLEKSKQEGLASRLNQELELMLEVKKIETKQNQPLLILRIERLRKEKKGKKTK